ECSADPQQIAAMLRVAAAGHRTLCLGQGAELAWTRRPGPLTSAQVLNIFRQKTSPAFEVALQLGAIIGGDSSIAPILTRFSTALGIAYQIRDDLDDLDAEDASDLIARRPTLPLAILQERMGGKAEEKALVQKALFEKIDEKDCEKLLALMNEYEVID